MEIKKIITYALGFLLGFFISCVIIGAILLIFYNGYTWGNYYC